MSPGENRHQTQLHVDAQQRQKVRDQVRERFARYGDKPCARLLEAAAFPRGVQRMLDTLGVPSPAQFEQQLDAIARFIVEHGPRIFLQRLDAPERRNRSMDTKNVTNDRYDGTVPLADTQPIAAPEAPAPPIPASAETQPIDSPHGDPKRGITPPEWFDHFGRYIGPERRCGMDRRTGEDRRGRVDSISKNIRFGGDRRRNPRRRDDRVRMYASKPK